MTPRTNANCCYRQFCRLEKSGEQDEGAVHIAAVKRFERFRAQHHGKPLYVAEMDLRSCFDCIAHDTARQCLDHAVAELALLGDSVDPRALRILEAVLSSYCFPEALRRARAVVISQGRTPPETG